MCLIYPVGPGIQLHVGAIKISTGVGQRRMAHLQDQALIVTNPAGLRWYGIKNLIHADLYCTLVSVVMFFTKKMSTGSKLCMPSEYMNISWSLVELECQNSIRNSSEEEVSIEELKLNCASIDK